MDKMEIILFITAATALVMVFILCKKDKPKIHCRDGVCEICCSKCDIRQSCPFDCIKDHSNCGRVKE